LRSADPNHGRLKKIAPRPVSVRYNGIIVPVACLILILTGCAPQPTRPRESIVHHSWYGDARTINGRPVEGER